MAEKIQVLGLLFVMFVSGAIIAFNLIGYLFGLEIGLKFSTGGFFKVFWLILARSVGIVMMVLSGWAFVNVLRN